MATVFGFNHEKLLAEVWQSFARMRVGLFSPVRVRTHAQILARSYAKNLANRLPLIYAVLLVDIAVLAVRFQGQAPVILTMVVPALLAALALWRGLYWLPHLVGRRTTEVIERDLERMSLFGGYYSLALVIWTMFLYRFGDEALQSLIQYVTAVSCYTAILGLGQSPRTATSVAFAAMLPATAFQVFQSHPNALAVALVQLLVTLLLLAVTIGYHRDFVRLELSRQHIARREREAARLAEANRYNATVDPLTGALNRRALLARLERELVRPDDAKTDVKTDARTEAKAVWLAMLDLDGFKHVNDTYGHAAGDTVLREVSVRISALERLHAHGRLGGDEFALLVDGSLSDSAAIALMEQLSASLRQPIAHNGVTLRLAASIGLRRVESDTVGECLERCDAALYKAKEKGDGAVVAFTEEDETELRLRSTVTRQFNDCRLDERLQLVYQPIVDIEQNAIVGYEAFARWSPDGNRWLGPASFLSLAQATGRTGELTRLVLARSIAESGIAHDCCDLSINLSPRDVLRDGTAEVLADIVQQSGASPARIILEITERALHHDPLRAARQLAVFRDQGFRIALDDFGTGWSSLSHVRTLPLDRLKIDRGLAMALTDDPGARAIAGTIVGLAWQMGLDCTIEGIENDRQVETARALGLKLMQGFHFGRPRPASEISAFGVPAQPKRAGS